MPLVAGDTETLWPHKTAMTALLTITGTTASGKTRLATELAYCLNGEVISADSRQVFRGMDIGTGKDLQDYVLHGEPIPYHLIDIREAGEEYNLYQFLNDFRTAYDGIVARHNTPILCGGPGMYVDAVVRGYELPDAPVDAAFRSSIAHKSDSELTQRLASISSLHNHTDTETRERLVRALEIAEYRLQHPGSFTKISNIEHVVVALRFPRAVLVKRIEQRLSERLDSGMVEEVEGLLKRGVPAERLLRYGLEYRHLTLFLQGHTSRTEMFENLFTDIRRFSKRQMTWFRRMERNGVAIHWIDGQLPLEEKVAEVMGILI